ncbi:DUF550 domain-containing protein [Mycobacteroides abscessus]|uniref:dATP/dGTP pyrophosphohydrolase domain-containing protein n=1 Tax=Mycobacteroides abscessus TaxID=36809 RepID=UPI0009A91C05|nr:dATP/dGTP pyrophosphohydrolase domain-containing protein [Mycobacteroides abscessus]MDM2015305.1 DUF550 domain-containing protein [Mycobacteroides abscessus]MDM2019683.1 DUF550 domain-containing protein [Mycobacteroides abscessus]MDM2025108.1 DUF550 domain-containing protein [Mycobacteroides abscessus]MDM2027779.1 DUF550 domain-containing protein [Mycobacteroides abscessus]MDM2034040.1 DUF550 domain-containing protein [Mycobacteroides abscessus]
MTSTIDAAHLARQRAFSLATFGPGARTKGVLDHIVKELDEIRSSPGDISEWVDVVILALDGAWRAGWEPQQIIDAIIEKQTRNEQRTWPDWRTADPDKAIEHVRDSAGEATPTAGMSRRRDAAQVLAMISWVRKQLKKVEVEANSRAEVEFPEEKVKAHVVIDGNKVEVSSTTRVQPSAKLKVEDADRLAVWVQQRWPTEIVPAVRPSFLTQLAADMAMNNGCLIDADGEVCPWIGMEAPSAYTTTRLLKDADQHLAQLLGRRSLADLMWFIENDVTDLDDAEVRG